MPISETLESNAHDFNDTGYTWPEGGWLDVSRFTSARLGVIAGNDDLGTAVTAVEVSVDRTNATELGTVNQEGQSSELDLTGWKWARIKTKTAEGAASVGRAVLYLENATV